MSQQTQKQDEKVSIFQKLLLRIPIPVSVIYTFQALNFIFTKKSEILTLMKINPYENSIEERLSLVSKVLFALGLIIGVLIQITMLFRIILGTKLNANGSDPFPITFLNKLLNNSLQNYFFFLGNLLYFAFSDNQNADQTQVFQKNVVLACVSILYILSRIVFCVTYAVGVATGVPALRAFGHIPCHFLSIMLLLQNLGYNMFSSYL
ncbi:GMP-PDE, delta subunit family protein, putative (macronuclear) [Tetrahymena thermophila SB210]|uniref:GMP-PDE, delta subunit family protein, putative n=1 Tax=Tetrahymena thermophila (strain SB210) TaxID=312017 RepID=W7XLK7_TETTS|nr:GMP-PDE, delta subunit family protein, putative [Tetrahymena thermophila SB210]EWS76459.1 GMP-PDE, delta subunit family protein, putative [Tetrahymena thermophila SB210]|eukprot:XP_012651006.1 GMP-PDE, delta subunit family protein, putative [Tetrahymena thermophila SB210]